MPVWCSYCGRVTEGQIGELCWHNVPGNVLLPCRAEPLPRWHPLAPSLGPWWVVDMLAPWRTSAGEMQGNQARARPAGTA
jgi:hypothetical protein